MAIVDIATRRPVTVAMLFLAIVVFGLVALSRLKVNLLPDLSYPTITVRTELTGAAPVEIESLITKPVEEALGTIKNVRELRSHSRTGQSDVIVEFAWGTDMNLASVDVREKLDILFLPLEAERPVLLRFDPSTEPIVRLALAQENAAGTIGEDDLRYLRRLAEDDIRDTLDGVAGVAAVKVSGGLEEEIQITVDQEKLAQLNLAIDDVAERIRAENVNLSGGRLEQGDQRFLVRTVNEYESLKDIRDTILTRVGNRPVYVRDIATVVRGYKDREAITRVNGSEAVELAIYKEGDANTVRVAERLQTEVGRVEDLLADGLTLDIVQDQSQYIKSAIDNVTQAAMIGGLIAVVVLFGFLRNLRSTIIIGLTIPISIVGTFALMHFSELSLNIMSLGGIALAVGLLVDNSIVVLENIARRRELGDSVLDAARNGTSEVSSAITASTLTTIAVFLPMVFITGIAGQLFRDQALTVTYALLFSLLLALLLIPMLASVGARPSSTPATSTDPKTYNWFDRSFGYAVRGIRFVRFGIVSLVRIALTPVVWVLSALYRITDRIYRPLLSWALRRRLIVVSTALLLFAGAAALVPRLGTELIPQLAQGEFSAELRLPPGTPLVTTDAAVQRAQRAIDGRDDVARSHSVAGTGNRIDANPVDAGEHTGSLSVALAPAADNAAEAAVIDAIRQEVSGVPGLSYEFKRPELLSLAVPLEVVIRGFNLADLDATAARVTELLQANDRYADVRSSIEGGNPEIQIRFDQERAAALGIASRDIADRVVANVRGSLATRYTWRDTKIDVTVRSVDTRDSSISDVRELIVNPDSTRPVTLEAVADIAVSRGPAEIRRIDQERVAVVSATPAYGDLGTAAQIATELLSQQALPAGVSVEVVGQSADMLESQRSMQFSMMLAIFLVYLVMASQFESLRHPFVILLTIPMALIGAVGALYIAGMNISVVALIGAIMLVGIVVNNGIVLIDLINQLRADGKALNDAITEAAAARLRPILMTTLTTALGLLPMAIGWGDGSEVRAPMAVTVIGGLISSMLLTLVLVPVVYSLFERERQPAATARRDREALA
ncbi:MAG: efflux RND transporter permease subunit [Pseudomonadota bacterium]